ncbi:MAG: nuclear transport factor 2 family protein [Beijerinckiaceae bacterium]
MTPTQAYLASPRAIQDLRVINARFIHNYVTNDVPSHDALLHARFLYINSSGKRIDRAPYLKRWATGFDPRETIYWDVRDELIHIFGNTALVRATNKYTLRQNGSETTGMACYTDVYVYENDTWLCIQAQITGVAPDHWPGDETIVSVYINGVRQQR